MALGIQRLLDIMMKSLEFIKGFSYSDRSLWL